MRVLGSVALALALTLAPSRAADDATEKDLKRLQGDWQMVQVTKDGATVSGEKLKGRVWTFKGTKLIPQDDKDDTSTVKIDASQRPAALDITDKNGDTVEGIYKFTGDDKLTVCGHSNSKRPKDFAAGPKSGAILFVLERVKK